jgi:hypothetical protein
MFEVWTLLHILKAFGFISIWLVYVREAHKTQQRICDKAKTWLFFIKQYGYKYWEHEGTMETTSSTTNVQFRVLIFSILWYLKFGKNFTTKFSMQKISQFLCPKKKIIKKNKNCQAKIMGLHRK